MAAEKLLERSASIIMADLRKILESFNRIESIDAAQKSVKQLPALFKPRNTSPQLSGSYPGKNATQGYLVGEDGEQGYGLELGDSGADETPDGVSPDTKPFLESEDDANAVERAVLHRIMMQHSSLLGQYGPQAVMDAVRDVAEFVGDVDEIGSSDVSAYVRSVEQILAGSGLSEAKATEDVISTVKKKLGDYLSDLSKEIKSDSDLKDKTTQSNDKIASAVKTIVTDDGKEIKIHGNEDDGFRITIKDKAHSATFESLDHAVMACEMYLNRRRMRTQNEDYLEEQ
jgi:hypothetical protein